MTRNPSRKFTRKLENVMLITVVRQWSFDNSHERDAVLAKAASSCCQSTVKSASRSRHFFLSFFLSMTNLLENVVVNEFDHWLRKATLVHVVGSMDPRWSRWVGIIFYNMAISAIVLLTCISIQPFEIQKFTKQFCHDPKLKMMFAYIYTKNMWRIERCLFTMLQKIKIEFLKDPIMLSSG